MTQAEYLEAEFRRYFPAAPDIVVTDHDDKSITVDVWILNVVKPLTYTLFVGSDDPWYDFFLEDGHTQITIPFQREA
jgi:hypothetical protein